MTWNGCIPSIVVLHETKQSKLSLTNCFLCWVLPLRSFFKARAPPSKSAAVVSWCIRDRNSFASNFSEKYINFSANICIKHYVSHKTIDGEVNIILLTYVTQNAVISIKPPCHPKLTRGKKNIVFLSILSNISLYYNNRYWLYYYLFLLEKEQNNLNFVKTIRYACQKYPLLSKQLQSLEL